MITRRLFTSAILATGILTAQDKDTFAIFIPNGDYEFGIGIRSSIRCTLYLVRVFYLRTIDGLHLLLSEESAAPCSGLLEAWGETDKNFRIPRKEVQFVEIRFMTEMSPSRKINKGEVEG